MRKKKKMAKDERAVVVTTTINIIKYIDSSCLHLRGGGEGGCVFNLRQYELCVKMCVCVKGALHRKGSNDMIRRDPSDPDRPPPPSFPPRKIQICTNPKFFNDTKIYYQIKSRRRK